MNDINSAIPGIHGMAWLLSLGRHGMVTLFGIAVAMASLAIHVFACMS
jgi:hypothetical protein